MKAQLAEAARILGDEGLVIFTVAASPTPEIAEACGTLPTPPLIRDMGNIADGENYLVAEERYRAKYRALIPALKANGVAVGIQNHHGRFITSAAGLRRVVEEFDPAQIGAIWDPAHCALCGELPEYAADILWSHLKMVNLKNAFWRRTSGPEAEAVAWNRYWTSGRQGLCSWKAVYGELKKRGYTAPLTLCAEYGDEHSVERLTIEDIAFARSLE